MNIKINDVSPEGETQIIDFIDKVFSQGDDIERDVVIKRQSSYIRARSNSLEYRIDAGYRLLAFPVSIEQIKKVFLFYYRNDGALLCDLDWKQSALWEDGTCFVPMMKSARDHYPIPEANPDSIPKTKQYPIPEADQDSMPGLNNTNSNKESKEFNCLLHSLWVIPLGLIFGVFYATFWIIKKIFSAVKSCCAKGRCKFWI